MDYYKIEVELYVNLVEVRDDRLDFLAQTYQDLQDHKQKLEC